jgi:hypothetical protein
MAATARTWFYTMPESSPYLLQERVNGTVWMNRLTEVYFVTERAEAPFQMRGEWRGQTLVIAWHPEQWFRLTGERETPDVVAAFSNILRLPAALTYTDSDGKIITEWHRDGGEARWREIQGNPTYQNPERLKR